VQSGSSDNDPFIYGSTERLLHLGIEAAIDIGNHLISDLRLRKPENNRQIFEILAEDKIIPGALAENLGKMVQFRNILVHDYVKLNREIIFDIVINNLDDIENFVRIIVDYI
jgi:uncharacterized protein YutE (UPF0331/DUF86 family)